MLKTVAVDPQGLFAAKDVPVGKPYLLELIRASAKNSPLVCTAGPYQVSRIRRSDERVLTADVCRRRIGCWPPRPASRVGRRNDPQRESVTLDARSSLRRQPQRHPTTIVSALMRLSNCTCDHVCWRSSGQPRSGRRTSPRIGANAAIHLGPVGVTPRLALRNIGIDSNVLNASGSPQRDFTATFAPGADLWLSIGRARLSSRTDVGWIYFKELTDQRSFEVNQQERLDLVLARFVPHVAGGYLRTRQRPNLEIDARALRTTTSGDGGVLFRLGPKLSLDTAIVYRNFEYAEEQAIESIRLATALNHTEQEVTGTVRYSLTPLTTLVVLFTDEHDRFQFSPLRDSNSARDRARARVQALRADFRKASVGYRRFDA